MPYFQVAFRGEILVLQHLKEKCNFLLTVFKFDKKAKQFTKQKRCHLDITLPGPDVKVLQFSCVVEGATGLKQPCLLVEQQLDCTLHFFFLVANETLTQVASFRHKELASCQDVLICDGPSISWLSNSKIHFMKWNSNDHSLEYTSYISPIKSECLSLLWCGTAGINDELVSLLHSKEGIVLAGAKCGLLPSENIVPNIYSSVLACLYVNQYGNDSCYSSSSFQQASDHAYNLDVYIGTSRSQVIRFVAGKLVSHCQLPFDDPSIIHVIQGRNDSNHVIVQSKQGNVCLIDPAQNKLLNEWSNKSLVLLDDFLENGTEQVCLLRDTADIKDMFKGYVLSDWNGASVASDQDDLTKEYDEFEQSSLESIQSTIQALRARYQACNAHLYEVRSEYNDKKMMVGNTCETLYRIAGQPQAKENINTSHLVSFIGEEACQENQEEECQQKSSAINFKGIWQRVIGDKWVVGVEFECAEKSNISDISLSLLSCTKDYLKSSCQPILQAQAPRSEMLVPGDQILMPSIKRQKLDKPERNTNVATVITTLPTFYKGIQFAVLAALSWTHCQNEDVKTRQVTCCGCESLNIDQLLTGDLNVAKRKAVEDTKRDLIALREISIQTMLTFDQFSSLSNMASALRKEFGSIPVFEMTSEESKEILLKASYNTGLLEGVAVLIDCCNGRCLLQLLTRNVSQVYFVISKLRHALPADVTIHVNQPIDASSDYQFLDRIQGQLDHLKSEIQRALLDKQKTLHKDLSDGKCTGTKLDKIRSTFEERRKVFSFVSRHSEEN